MAKLEQTYAWSESRVKTLRECRWKYYLTYYLSWEGWLPSAPQEKRRAYMLKNMTNIPMWVGSIVHDTIEYVITKGRDSGEWLKLEEAQAYAIQLLRKGWKQSVDKRWQASAKANVNLYEHFYQEDVSDDQTKAAKFKVLSSLKSFYSMSLFSVLTSLKKDDWLTLEDFQKFRLSSDEEVSVKIDCGFKHNGKVYLIDWKTGKVNDSVLDQLTTYAMYAMKMGWSRNPEDIVIVPVYLFAYNEIKEKAIPELKVTIEHMKRQAGIIQREYPLLTEAHNNKNNPSAFPRTENECSCKRCFFKDMCPGAKTEISADETPF